MPPFTIDVELAATPQVVFDALTDPRRLERWLYTTESITDVSGPFTAPGTTFTQRAVRGVERMGGVVRSDPPRLWHIRLDGFGERADVVFELHPTASGTRLRMTVDVRNRPRFLGPVVDRLTSGMEQRLWRRVADQIREDIGREGMTPVREQVYVLEGGGWLRVAHVIDVDASHVHVALRSGVCRFRPTTVEDIDCEPRKMRDHLDLRPLQPRLSAAAAIVQVGSTAMLADGGHGLAHCPLTLGEFRNGRPQLLGVEPIDPGLLSLVDWWRQRGGAAFGEERPPIVGAYYSVALQAIGIEAIGFGVVKLLRQQFRGVHVRVYANTYAERPSTVQEWALGLQPVDPSAWSEGRPLTQPAASPHLALSHASFRAALPDFIQTALVDPDELVPIEAWKVAGGTFV